MTLLKSLAALVAVGTGGLGVALSAIAIYQTRFAVDRLDRELPPAVERTESVVTSSVERAGSAIEFLERTRERLNGITGTLDRFVRDDSSGALPLLEELDPEIVARLQRAEEAVRSLQSGLQSASSMMMVLDSLPFVSQRGRAVRTSKDDRAQHLAADVATFNDSLELIARGLRQIRTEGRADSRQIARLETALNGADNELGEVQSGVQELRANLEDIGTELRLARESAPEQIRNLAEYVVLFLVCFAVSQFWLLGTGLRAMVGLFGRSNEVSKRESAVIRSGDRERQIR